MSAELYDGKGSVSILSNRGLVVADMAEIDNSGEDITAIITIIDNIAAQTNSQNCALAARILSERASTLQRGLGRFKVRASKVCLGWGHGFSICSKHAPSVTIHWKQK